MSSVALFVAALPLPQRVASKPGDKSVDTQAADDVITTAAPPLSGLALEQMWRGPALWADLKICNMTILLVVKHNRTKYSFKPSCHSGPAVSNTRPGREHSLRDGPRIDLFWKVKLKASIGMLLSS